MDWGNVPSANNWFEHVQNKIDTPLPGGIAGCLMCSKPFVMRMYTGFPDQVCPECYDMYKDCARIICINCRMTVAKVQPQLMDSGYYVQPQSVLSIRVCPHCSTKKEDMTDIIEVADWEIKHGKRKTILTPLMLDG